MDAKLANCRDRLEPRLSGAADEVEILQYRHRYLVYQTADNSSRLEAGADRAALQSNLPSAIPSAPAAPSARPTSGPPTMVAEGVDDMQMAWRVPDWLGTRRRGWCQRSTATRACGFELAPNLDAGISQRAAAIIGAQIMLASRGQEVFQAGRTSRSRCSSTTSPSPATDGVVRSVMQTSVLFRNAVTP